MDLSSRLSYLFGTEEYVRMRRQLVLLRDQFENLRLEGSEYNVRVICSGSVGEGIAYPQSDDDTMYYTTYQRVLKTYIEATRSGDVIMVPSKYSPGYCMLLDINGTYSTNLTYSIDEIPYLSSTLHKRLSSVAGSVIHGPCSSGVYDCQEFDFAFAISCSFWPDNAYGWIVRNRSGWPSYDLIQKIVRGGCHVVPVGDPDSPYRDHEWRLSFSVAERTLMHSINHAQFLTYNLLRLALKRIIEKKAHGVLCSYFMKTTLFYAIENSSPQLWHVDNLDTCFKVCLSILYDYTDSVYCPNYFTPEYNMIRRKINRSNRLQMLEIVGTLHTVGVVNVINLCGESFYLCRSLSLLFIEWKLDKDFLVMSHLNHTLGSVSFEKSVEMEANQASWSYKSPLCRMLYIFHENANSDQNEFINILMQRTIELWCRQLMDFLGGLPRSNKHIYRLHKTIESLLRLGMWGDVTTGRLTTATYMYLVGKTESALSVIRQLLSEYPPYALDGICSEFKVAAYVDVLCSRGYTIDYKAKHAWAPHYLLSSDFLNALPVPLQIWISTVGQTEIHPLTYLFTLECLSHTRLQNQLSVLKSTACLINLISDFKDDRDIAEVKLCVGIIKASSNDKQSACRWLSSVYRMKDKLPPPHIELIPSSVLIYIACLLNKQFK